MKLKIIKIFTILISTSLFFLSLSKNAVTIDYHGIKSVPSLDYFFMGSIAILGGGVLEEVIWLANPLCLISIFLLLMDKKSSFKLSLSALILSISFSFWKELLGAESGSPAKIISLQLGYYLWVISILILTIGTFAYFKFEEKEFDYL
ncbi:hypothetical protein OX283_010180 [Flavobacterium sp. SUN052]|uniref:hypothetical protein n=1 Tax=Flavobacterium sp. SUN052 TaxID=3002441 RepID=UPI00237DC7EC|nr:hypothetical protein [Flavobacterium sp. SUN052]MEC4005025.1 hypothetical protein [Flavobacterium sp. SUN052]